MPKQNRPLAFETDQRNNATEEQSSQGNLPVERSGEPPLPASNGHSQELPQSLRRGTSANPKRKFRALNGRLSLYACNVIGPDWRDAEVLLTVTETQAESLKALGLVRFRGRQTVTHLVLIEGSSVVEVKAALRQHVRHSLPVAEDNTTVRKSDGCAATFEHAHVPAWADGRLTHEDLTKRMRETLRKAGLL